MLRITIVLPRRRSLGLSRNLSVGEERLHDEPKGRLVREARSPWNLRLNLTAWGLIRPWEISDLVFCGAAMFLILVHVAQVSVSSYLHSEFWPVECTFCWLCCLPVHFLRSNFTNYDQSVTKLHFNRSLHTLHYLIPQN